MSEENNQELLAKIGSLAGTIQLARSSKESSQQFIDFVSPSSVESAPVTQALLTKHPHLPGRINRHKNRQNGGAAASSSHHPMHHRSNAHRHGSGSHQYRVGRPHRHHTLVMNHGSRSNNNSGSQTPNSTVSDNAAQNTNAASSSNWVSTNSRHRQLINSAVYEQDNQKRAQAIEQTRKQQLNAQTFREQAKLKAHLQRGAIAAPTNSGATTTHEIEVKGIRFRVTQNGSKLVKVSDLQPPSATPKVAYVGGVKFHRSKHGNLYRDGVLKAQRLQHGIKKVDEPCLMFSSTGTCAKGPTCRFVHDVSKVAVCRDFLQKGQCPSGDSCDLSHDLTPHRTPTCLHHLKGNCANSNCPYAHSNATLGAPVCRSYGLYGYCDQGDACSERHVWECPDFSNTGKCKRKGCKLPHRERASVLRNQKNGEDEEDGDLSSDEESVNEDDVDSDEVEEFLGDGAPDDAEFKGQNDFISL